MMETVPLVEIVRGQIVESLHRGIVVVVDGGNRIVAGIGGAESLSYLRSAAKPFQAIPLITSGAADRFNITPAELAVITGSHSGQPMHVETVRELLSKIGLQESDLRCGAHPPFDAECARQLTSPPTALHNNCSGKHAGMLALALHLGAEPAGYDQPGSPVQRAVLETLAAFTGVPESRIQMGMDGCGVPTFAVPLRALALAYARLAAPEASGLSAQLQAAARRLTAAMTAHPELVAGTRGRLDTELMAATGGRVAAKVGAEGVHALAVFPADGRPAGLGMAVKIEDGDERKIRGVVVIETLRQLGILSSGETAALAAQGARPIRNHRGDEVGRIRPVFTLS